MLCCTLCQTWSVSEYSAVLFVCCKNDANCHSVGQNIALSNTRRSEYNTLSFVYHQDVKHGVSQNIALHSLSGARKLGLLISASLASSTSFFPALFTLKMMFIINSESDFRLWFEDLCFDLIWQRQLSGQVNKFFGMVFLNSTGIVS